MPSGLQGAIRGHVFHRGDPGFEGAAHVFNPRFDHVLPTAVARPVDGQDVRDAIRYTVAHSTPVRARSGGHSYARLLDPVKRSRPRSAQAELGPLRPERRHGDGRRRRAADRCLLGAGQPRRDRPRRHMPVGGDRWRDARRRLRPGRSPPRAHDRQPARRQDRHRRRAAAHGRRSDRCRPAVGAQGRRRRQLRGRHRVHVQDPPDPGELDVLRGPLAVVVGRRRDRRLAVLGSARQREGDLDPAPELRPVADDHRQRAVPRAVRRRPRTRARAAVGLGRVAAYQPRARVHADPVTAGQLHGPHARLVPHQGHRPRRADAAGDVQRQVGLCDPGAAGRGPGGDDRGGRARGRRRAAVRRLRRGDKPDRADRDRVRAPAPAVLHPVLRRRRDLGMDQPSSHEHAPVRLREGPTRTTSTRR